MGNMTTLTRVAWGAASMSREVAKRGRVLVVDDELPIARALQHLLGKMGYGVEIATDGPGGVEAALRGSFDVILSDIHMPELSGLALLKKLRDHARDVPVVLMTGDPKLETAIEAIGLGAAHYLTKPIDQKNLKKVLDRVSTLHRLARVRRDAAELLAGAPDDALTKTQLSRALDRALDTMWMAFQPIVDGGGARVVGYEALLRSREPELPDPPAVLAAAEKVDRLDDLGQRVRSLSAQGFAAAPPDTLLFVNLHARDLVDPDLFDESAPLAAIAHRVVLEVTERASLDDVPDIVQRVASLRALGFRVAIDDLGAGYAGLSSFVLLEPEFVKLDMSLVRGAHTSPIRQRLIGSLASLCKELGVTVLAEGVEVAAERDIVLELGCEWMQGYFFGRPAVLES